MGALQHTRDEATVKAVASKGLKASKKAKVVLSAKKIMATVFFDNQGVVYTTYTSNTINSAAYIEFVKECNHKLARKRP
ncbi:Hypothetical protein FKW44_020202 [Caligus rogercresseyi]|uniref:Uncharacterized protein n=1 Tax=Caligus rogercresseyi TaxID=217165 RepID=A0A7T8GXM6_CALRO|nr:Hypothetical protein FKW44_020202 [Caligus rogercresseyi]